MVLFVLNATATTEIYTYGPPLSPHDGLPSYRRHLDGLRGRLGRAMGETARRPSRAGLGPWIEPGGGMFLWARLPDGLDSAVVARHALEQGVVLAPGDVFSPSRSAAAYMRFNVAQCADRKSVV